MRRAWIKDGRLFRRDNRIVVGDPPCCPCDPQVLGACCYTDGTCQQQTFADCSASGAGTWLGPGISCGPLTCHGACCRLDGTCTRGPRVNCPSEATWIGYRTTCASNPCASLPVCCAGQAPPNCVAPYPSTNTVTISGTVRFQPYGGCCGSGPVEQDQPWVGPQIVRSVSGSLQYLHTNVCADVATINAVDTFNYNPPFCNFSTGQIQFGAAVSLTVETFGQIDTNGAWQFQTSIEPTVGGWGGSPPAVSIGATGGNGTAQNCGGHSVSSSRVDQRFLYCGTTNHAVSMNLTITVSGWSNCGGSGEASAIVVAPTPEQTRRLGGNCIGCGDSLTGGALL